jgi:hypothetical protein
MIKTSQSNVFALIKKQKYHALYPRKLDLLRNRIYRRLASKNKHGPVNPLGQARSGSVRRAVWMLPFHNVGLFSNPNRFGSARSVNEPLRDRSLKWTALSQIRTETLETVGTFCLWRSILLTYMFTYITHTGKIIPSHHRMHLQLDKEKHVTVAAVRHTTVQVKKCYWN